MSSSLYRREFEAWQERTGERGRPDLRPRYTTPHGGMSAQADAVSPVDTDDGKKDEKEPEVDGEWYMAMQGFSAREERVAREAVEVLRVYRKARDSRSISRGGYDGENLIGTVDSQGRFIPGFIDKRLPEASDSRRTQVAWAAAKLAQEKGVSLVQPK